MTEKEQPSTGQKRCLICHATSEETVLLHGVERDGDIWVCVRCLPRLIHGAH